MEVRRVETIGEYIEACRENWKLRFRKSTYFRGQADADWALAPGCARYPHNLIDDEMLFQEWLGSSEMRLNISEYYAQRPLLLLSKAQHFGLPTRLLDWSFSPISGVIFCVYISI